MFGTTTESEGEVGVVNLAYAPSNFTDRSNAVLLLWFSISLVIDSKLKISNDQVLMLLEPNSRPRNQKWEITKIKINQNTKSAYVKPNEQLSLTKADHSAI